MFKRAAGLLAKRGQAASEAVTMPLRGLANNAQKEVKLPPQYSLPGKYAAALYMAATKGNALDKVEKDLSSISTLLKESKDFSAFVSDPSVTTDKRVKTLGSVLGKMGATDITKRFIDVMIENNRISELGKVLEKFSDLTSEQKGEVKATVTTAVKMSPDSVKEVQQKLKEWLEPGQTLVLEQKVDPSIISGAIVDIGDKHLDMSVITRLRNLEKIIRETAI